MRCYLDGVEINQVKELEEICKLDDWYEAYIEWLMANRGPKVKMDVLVMAESPSLEEGEVLEMWSPSAPLHRASQIGALTKRLTLNQEDQC